MTGIEARDFVKNQIAEHAGSGTPTGGAPTGMKLSWELATDLSKLRHHEIGHLSAEMFESGTTAFQEQCLFGYRVEIDRAQDGHVVEFVS